MRSRRVASYAIVVAAAVIGISLGALLGLGKWETYGLTALVGAPAMVACFLWAELPAAPRVERNSS